MGTGSCDPACFAARPGGTLIFAPFAASDGCTSPSLADEAYKVARHCATLNQDRIAVFAEDDAIRVIELVSIMPDGKIVR